MTLVATLHTPHTVWMLADRRLYYGPKKFKDDACKIMSLETIEEVALLGYAGLGATAKGIEPSDWISNVLRGRTGKIEDLLGLLGQSMKKQLPAHLVKFPRHLPATHIVIAPAYVDGKLTVYSIGVDVDRKYGNVAQDFKKHARIVKPNVATTYGSCLTGSGAAVVSAHIGRLAAIRKLAGAHDRGKVQALTVADELAKLNLFVHANTADGTVGPRCIVAWRYNKKGVHQGGGGHQSYTAEQRDANVPFIPTIGNGMDVRAIVGIHMPDVQRWLASGGKEAFVFDEQRIDTELQKLPTGSDEKLR
jgi:hypothetical protein